MTPLTQVPMTQLHAPILIVDDERYIRRNLQLLLEAAGYQADMASDGEEAFAMCQARQYNVALVDLQMPKMNGLELLRSLRELRPETAVVILTAYGSVARAVDAMKLGAVDFLEKPFDPQALRLLVDEVLLRQRLEPRGSVDDFLRLAALARERGAHLEARVYLKAALLRDLTRPEPTYWLGVLCEREGDLRHAAHYYYMALDANPTFPPAREALTRLGWLTRR
jgi:DNA-binding response OmpR family regulator